MAERKGFLALIMQVFVLLLLLASFGLLIATLVTTLNVQKQQKQLNVAPNSQSNNITTIYNETVYVYNQTIYINNATSNNLQVELNVPPPQAIQPGQTQYSSYQSVVQLLKQGLNSKVDPCDDFYTYTCGAFNQQIGFYSSDMDNYNKMVQQMNNQDYVNKSPSPVQQTVSYFNKCKAARANWNALVADGGQVKNAINTIMAGDSNNATQNLPFPMLDQTSIVADFPNRIGLGYLFSKPEGEWGVTSLVSSYVDTNWIDPQGTKGYAMFIDQPTTFVPYTYYVKTWDSTRASLVQEVISTMNTYAFSQNMTLNQTQLTADANALVDFDYMLATKFSTDETTRRQFARSYNPMTIKQLGDAYPRISWHEYIPTAMLYSGDAMQILGDSTYTYIVMEPQQLQKLHDALVADNSYGITPNLVLNYVYYSTVRSMSDYLPWAAANPDGMENIAKMRAELPQRKLGKKRRNSVVPEKRRFERKQMTDVDQISVSCAGETMEMMQYANARIFIDNLYPTADSRTAIRNNVAKVASSILIGFRSLVDQLDWMSVYSKKGGYNKIEQLVKNIAYPDWITDDALLTSYYAKLGLTDQDDYFTMVNKATVFNLDVMWNNLVVGTAANRLDFNGPPGTTNAWYQPELNSITFPAGILHQPFYDPNWPASVNFGAMGVIAGHELTHGFDDEGVQWDGVGNLQGWMDAQSLSSFTDMANCVVNEYSNFCPLNASVYGKGACIDGAQTQGENIADNGGIHAAFRAYKNFINLNGPDPQLPDGMLQGFTADQLFFLGFAQVWCQQAPSDAALERQILVDPHSPSLYRVWGTIQNFPAFKDAFHCPVSNYAPEKHCNVWTSDISSSYGMPQKDPNSLNIRTAQQAKKGQPQYDNYQSVVQLFKQGMNSSADPCNDFYSYTCGAWNSPDMSFDVSDNDNFRKMATQMMNTDYVNRSPNPVKQVVNYFNQCVLAQQNWDNLVANGTQAAAAIQALMNGDTTEGGVRQNTTQTTWPMYTQQATTNLTLPDGVTMGFLLGSPGGMYGVSTLVSGYVDTNWVDPQGTQGYSYYIDQPTTLLPNTYYRKAWSTYQSRLQQTVITTMNTYAKSQGATLDQTRLQQDAINLVQFDYLLAMNFSTDDTTRRNSARSYNPMTIDQLQAQYPFVFWHEFIPFTMLAASDSQHATLHNSTYKFIVMEPAQLQKLNDAVLDPNNPYGITPEIILNYVYYSQLNGQSQFLPFTVKNKAHQDILELHKETARQLPGKRRKGVVPRKRKWEKRQMDDITDAQLNCAAETMEMLEYANARVFIDNIYPTNDSRTAIRNNVAKVASSILIGFRSMIDQLDWMTQFTKKGAYAKIEQLVKNIAYPDFITDDGQLTAYHATLGIMDGDDYFTVYNKAVTFNLYQQWELLSINGSASRTDFNGPPGTTNAWYQPELNSITFPAAILRQPFYDPNWPASVNFGAMGVIAGHELTHGFDDEGVQWDGQGNLQGWMDNSSQISFNNMAACVVNEYSNFCPLDKATYGSGACLDGAQTQGENIADNGGIHAAFRAYKNYINLNGPDPQLPDGIMEGFTADQLFFLAFAQVWCQMTPSDAAFSRQILVDPHSPSIYRVWGTIQNFPAFKDAFHCPASSYAPDSHCNVWVSDISSSYGLPDVKQSDVNVAARPQAKQTNPDVYSAYQQSVDYFQASVNLSADPCNDFWSYSCGNYHKLVSFHLADAANLVLMAQQLTDPNYQQNISQSDALKKEQMFFNACVNVTTDAAVNNNSLVSQDIMLQKVTALKNALGVDFTAVTGGQITTLPDANALGNALGYLSFNQGIDTYVTPMVDTNWKNNSNGYQFFVDQNTAEKAKTYYAPSAWNITRPGYIASTVAVFKTYCIEQGIAYTMDSLNTKVSALVDFEQAIAYGYSTDDTTRRQYERSWKPMPVADMNTAYTFVNWSAYIQQMPAVAVPIVSDAGYQIVVMEQDMIQQLSKDLQNSTAFSPDLVVNYLYMRLLLDNAQYLPTYQAALKDFPVDSERGDVLVGKKRRRKTIRRRMADVSDVQTSCISMANDLMQFANGRVFVDYLYPQQSDRDFIRMKAGGVIQNIINSFQGMLMSLDWMDSPDKTNALQKTLQIQQNIAFPDWIANNTALDQYYSQLVFDAATDNYYTMWDKLIKFNLYLQYNQLTQPKTDRSDFLGQPGTVNAWYQPELNSITFPAGILRPPYYNALWPASINYGGLGVVAGHELTHGFDDEGVQWGPTGNLETWMANQTGFQNMANCVVEEYNNFCPLDPQKYSPNCINGAQTQGENIADNGGIHSAFRAYRTHVQLDGPDPNLPDPFFSQFTHDQLFFLSFGQVWCEQYRGDDGEYRQLMTDPHSPSKYRVFGTIQNYPAFQTAFNCPANSAYAPSDHCKVWVPNVEN